MGTLQIAEKGLCVLYRLFMCQTLDRFLLADQQGSGEEQKGGQQSEEGSSHSCEAAHRSETIVASRAQAVLNYRFRRMRRQWRTFSPDLRACGTNADLTTFCTAIRLRFSAFQHSLHFKVRPLSLDHLCGALCHVDASHWSRSLHCFSWRHVRLLRMRSRALRFLSPPPSMLRPLRVAWS